MNENEPLTGIDLLKKVKKLGNISREKKALECGYYTIGNDDQKRVNMIKFLNALMEAEGIKLDTTTSENKKSNAGRIANHRISVQSNGNLLIGSAYTKKMGLKPGDEFEISLGRKNIHLKQIESDK